MNDIDIKNWIDEQHSMMDRLEGLLAKQAEDHAKYARESSKRMHELNKMMENYVQIQRTHIEAYIRHIDTAVKSRDIAQRNAEMALEALRDEQKKCATMLDVLRHSGGNIATVTVGKIKEE